MDNLLRTKEKKRFKDWLLMALGWLLVILGVLGLFLPFLQGVLFITLGAALLSRVSPRMKRWGENIKERFAKLRTKKRGRVNLNGGWAMTNERVVIRAQELSEEDLYFLEQDKKKIQELRVKVSKGSDGAYRQAHQNHCFRCGTPSLIEIDRGRVKIDMCVNADCGAVHLDPGEMEKILERRKGPVL